VLLKPDGEIKLGQRKPGDRLQFANGSIANQECCGVTDGSNRDVRAVGYITMELMQKYAKEDGAIGIENLNRWAMDSDAVKFLSMTTSTGSIEELRKVSIIVFGSQQLTRPARVTEAFMAQGRFGVAGGTGVGLGTQGVQVSRMRGELRAERSFVNRSLR
jgi:hypothetical protein